MSGRYAAVEGDCVSCGSCVKVCPMDAIMIWKGVKAVIDDGRCVGCGRCAGECPVGAIAVNERPVSDEEEKMV